MTQQAAKFAGPITEHGGPFDLGRIDDYCRWRDNKLEHYPDGLDALTVEMRDPLSVTTAERDALIDICRTTNFAIYACASYSSMGKNELLALGRGLGLECLDHNLCADEDGIAEIRVAPAGVSSEYIPYTDRPLNWHTDGYYNHDGAEIRGIIMHCAADAASGGENTLLDHEVAYIRLRDENPDYVAALMRRDAMTIPANLRGTQVLRPACRGPVFTVHPADGTLHMRYTARTRSIEWKDDNLTREAVDFLASMLSGPDSLMFRVRLAPGQGIVCNNVLHARAGFSDDAAAGRQRLLLRGRYYDRIVGTRLEDLTWSAGALPAAPAERRDDLGIPSTNPM